MSGEENAPVICSQTFLFLTRNIFTHSHATIVWEWGEYLAQTVPVLVV